MIDFKIYKDYCVYSDGRIYSERRGKFLKPQIDKDGYLCIDIWKNGKKDRWSIHKLLAELFLPNPLNLSEVEHIDGNPQNNIISFNDDYTINTEETNLRWCTHKENMNNPKTRQRISEALKGKNAWNKGKHHSEETKKKMSESKLGNQNARKR